MGGEVIEYTQPTEYPWEAYGLSSLFLYRMKTVQVFHITDQINYLRIENGEG